MTLSMFGYLDNFQHSVILNLCVKVECIVEEIWKDITGKENIHDAIEKRGRGNLISAIRSAQGRKVKCLDTGSVFDSIGELSQVLGCDAASIPSSIERQSCCFGWTFVFVDMIDESFDELGYLNAAQNRYYKWPRAKRKDVDLWKNTCSAAV